MVATKLMIDPPRKGYWTRCASLPRRRIIFCVPLEVSIIGVDDCAISNASGKLSLILSSKAQLVANLGAQTIGADQEIGLVAGLGYTTRQSDGKTPPVIRKVEDGRAERQFDARLAADGVEQRALQIGAMNDQICRAPAAFGAVQRHSHKFGVIRTPQHDDSARP